MNGKKTLFWKFQWWYVCLCISQQSTEQLVELFLFNGHPPTYTEQFSLFFIIITVFTLRIMMFNFLPKKVEKYIINFHCGWVNFFVLPTFSLSISTTINIIFLLRVGYECNLFFTFIFLLILKYRVQGA